MRDTNEEGRADEAPSTPRARVDSSGERFYTPWERFSRDPPPLELPESEEALREAFVLSELRSIAHDHTISFEGTIYEVPRPLAREPRVTIYRYLLEDRIAVLLEGRIVEIQPVDLAANARSRRALRRTDDDEIAHPPPPSAADMAFDDDYGPVIQPDGGFPDA
jgi:hypothetical protein